MFCKECAMPFEQEQHVPKDLCGKCWKQLLHDLCERNKERRENAKTFNFLDLIYKVKCIFSGKPIPPDYLEYKNGVGGNGEEKVNGPTEPPKDIEARKAIKEGAWGGGIVEVMSAGYGSKFDGSCFLLAISDEEIERLLKEGKIVKVGGYF